MERPTERIPTFGSLKSSHPNTRSAALIYVSFSKETFEKLVRTSEIGKVKFLYWNRHLPDSLRLWLAVNPEARALDSPILSRLLTTPGKIAPTEVSFALADPLFNWNRNSGNPYLAKEVRTWKKWEDNGLTFFTSPSLQAFSPGDLTLPLGRFSIFAVKDPITSTWHFIIKKGKSYLTYRGTLPDNTDGWFEFSPPTVKDPLPKLVAATPEKGKKNLFWWTFLQDVPISKEIDFWKVPLKSDFPGMAGLKETKAQKVSLKTALIAKHGLFALWCLDDIPVGWTQESVASQIPSERDLRPSNLAPPSLLESCFQSLDSAIRNQIKKAIHL